ncbi:MAG: hypothetical protein WD960_09945 [Gemmatimonadota bacterium]
MGSPGSVRSRSPSALLVATGIGLLRVDASGREVLVGKVPDGARPTCLSVDPHHPGRAWAGTVERGILRSVDGGLTWVESGLAGIHVTAVTAASAREGLVWAGTEPSAVFRSEDGGGRWHHAEDLTFLPSSDGWAFPPRPETHHVRWIASHPGDADRLWVAVEAGALVRTRDGGISWIDRTEDGPRDTHELGAHPHRPELLRVAAGDGYFESSDGGETWAAPREGLEVGYFRSVAVDPGNPEVVVLSGATRPRSTYMAGHSDGRVFRREGHGPWVRVPAGWPDPPETIAPLLIAGSSPGEFWAADERGVHMSVDGGRSWSLAVRFDPRPSNLRGLALLPAARPTG